MTTNLSSAYPTQISITFTSNNHSTHYLDLTISLNYYTFIYHKIHYQIFQKSHHKYMYPHFSTNHPHHIFKGIIKTETIRFSRLSSSIDEYYFIHKHFSLGLPSTIPTNSLLTIPSLGYLTTPTVNEQQTKRKTNNDHRK